MQLNSLIGKKTYQKQGFLQDGTRVPLTGVVVSGNIVTQIKTSSKEGYNAIQLGIDAKKRANKAIQGHAKKASDQTPKPTPDVKNSTPATTINAKYFREVRVEDVAGIDLGTEIQVAEIFSAGDMIDVTGVSKGKGWAGGVKRWNFRGGPRTHGQSDRERAPGSIGQTTTPGRVYRGKKMAGRMGSDTVTVKNLEIIEVTADGILLIKGLVPGRVNGLLLVKRVGENKKFVPLYKEAVEEPIVEEVVVETENVEEVPTAQESPVEVSADVEVSPEEIKAEATVDEISQEADATSEEVSVDAKDEVGEVPSAESSSEPKEVK